MFIAKQLIAGRYLNIFSMNVRSLPKHSGELLAFLNTLETRFEVIILTEIGARNISLVEDLCLGYLFHYETPVDNLFGGVGMYITNSLSDVEILDGTKITKICHCKKCVVESMFIKFSCMKRLYVVGGIYRHPNGNIKHFE